MSDGASHRNGGMCGIGVHIINPQTKEVIKQVSEVIGEGTNTFSEYAAFIRGVEEAINICKKQKIEKVYLLADSNLVVSQVGGTWKARGSENVANAKAAVEELKNVAKEIIIDHIPREYNTDADELSRKATDSAIEQNTESKYPFLSK